MAVNVSFLQELLNSVAEQGRALLPKALFGPGENEEPAALARALVSGRGEASGVAIARQLLMHYASFSSDERRAFFRFLAEELQPDQAAAVEAAKAYAAAPNDATLARLQAAVDSPRQEFFRRLNRAPGGTGQIVAMRRDILRAPDHAQLSAIDYDLQHLLSSWFNRGFLVLRRIDWQTPAAILEKIIHYEAVHEIKGWDDLRRRLDPVDRRCFAFFHPAMVDEPLIFVEVALTQASPEAIGEVLEEERKGAAAAAAVPPTTAVFYSISNCQEGLKGISFGNFLLKQVVEELVREVPSLKTFVTLSPVPTFARWLDRALAERSGWPVTVEDRPVLELLSDPGWPERETDAETLRGTVMALAAHYFLAAKGSDNRPVDPVARFHLGNGARLERINWLGDASEKGLREGHGLMVNYRYDLREIERNHEAYANEGTVAASKGVRALLRPEPKPKPAGEVQRLLPVPKRKELPGKAPRTGTT